MELQINKQYKMRNGISVIITEKHFNNEIDVMIGRQDDGKYSWFERLTGKNYSIIGYHPYARRLDFTDYDIIEEIK